MEKSAGRRRQRGRAGETRRLGERERRRLVQLGVCLALFLTALFGRGTDRLHKAREELAVTIQTDGDFDSVLAVLDRSVVPRQSAGKTALELWMGMLLPRQREQPPSRQDGPLYQSALKNLSRGEGIGVLLGGGTAEEEAQQDPMGASGAAPAPTPEPDVVVMEYTGPALPDNTTMDKYALGLEETVMPLEVMQVTSGFGWREDPVGEGDKFHSGLDLVAAKGTPVRAFAAGTVDYIGESSILGLYLQLDHGNGVTSFYAHCSKLLVHKGDKVEAGQKVAESGATGDVTGPHLHFELKKDGIKLNPAYYVTLS